MAVAFAAKGFDVLGFDINENRLNELRSGQDSTSSVDDADLQQETLVFSNNEKDLSDRDVLIVAVPTPVDHAKRPDLSPFRNAAATVGRNLKPGAIVVFESTVYPGATEEIAVPVLEKESGLLFNKDFAVGYSPERINPGDTERVLRTSQKSFRVPARKQPKRSTRSMEPLSRPAFTLLRRSA